jgi:hypothetical protein
MAPMSRSFRLCQVYDGFWPQAATMMGANSQPSTLGRERNAAMNTGRPPLVARPANPDPGACLVEGTGVS